DGASGGYAWSWELKSLNGKGLELRLRLPPGWDAVEVPVRALAKALTRGTVYGTLAVRREGAAPAVKVNEPVLDAVLAAMRQVAGRIDAAPPTLDGILAIRGVVEVAEAVESEDERRAAEEAVVTGF